MKSAKKKSQIVAPQTVLILDKDAGMLKLIKNHVETVGTREVLCVDDPDKAWERLETQPIDIVIMDWKMKAPGGTAFYERIRSDERMEAIPIILISGFVTKDDITIAKMDPHTRFLVKPFTEEILVAIIKKAHSTGVAEREKRIAAGTAVITSSAAQAIADVTAGGKNDLGLMVQKGAASSGDLGLMVQKGEQQGGEFTATQSRDNVISNQNVKISRDPQATGEFEIKVEKPAVGGNYDHKMSAHTAINDMQIRQEAPKQGVEFTATQPGQATLGAFEMRTTKETPAVTGQDIKVSTNNHLQDFVIRQERPQVTASGGQATQTAAPQGAAWTATQSGPTMASGGTATQKAPDHGNAFDLKQSGSESLPTLDDLVFDEDVSAIENDLKQANETVTTPPAPTGEGSDPAPQAAAAEPPIAPLPPTNYFDNPPKTVEPVKTVPERVLIVDGDQAAVQMIENYMRAIGTKEFDKFSNGRDAWNAIRDRSYDLIVMDWKQKGMSGLCLYNRIRSERRTVRVPVIVMSGFVHKEDFRLLDESSYTNFLEKPFSMGVFGKALNETIQESSNHTRTLNTIVELLNKAMAEKRDVVTVIKGILREVPNASQFVMAAGQYFFAKGMLIEAEKTLKIAHKLEPNSVAVMSELGKVYHRANRPQEAYAILKKANKFSPGAIERLCLLGEVGLNLSNTDEARKYFKEALQIDDENTVANAGVTIANNLAEHMVEQGQQPVTAKFASLLNIIGITFVRNKMATRGIEQYRAAMCFVHEQGTLAKLHFNLGMAYLRSESLEDAEKWFESAAKLADVDFTKASAFADRVKAMRGGVVKPTLLGETDALSYAEESDEDAEVDVKAR
jgi:two-component system chemotaxis response regulator CheY